MIESLGPILRLFNTTVIRILAEEDGSLRLETEEGYVLTVSANPDYESWEFVGRDGSLVVCTPGGELAIWDRDTSM